MLNKLLLLLLTAALLSCASTPDNPEDDGSRQTLWPAPPAEPRYQYLFSIYSSDDFLQKTDEEKMREFLYGKSKPKFLFKRPIDLAVSNGKVYLIDSERPIINVFDLARRRLFAFGYRLEGKLSNPVSLATDQQGNVYVADRNRNAVIKYDTFGLFSSLISLKGLATQIAGIAVDSKNNVLYVVDRGGIDSNKHQLIKFTLEGELLSQIGTRGGEAVQFNLPMDVTVGSDGAVYVLDTGNFRVQKLSPDGEFVDQWGKAGQLLGQFGMPRSISIDAEDNIYVSDAQFGNVQIFNSNGRLLMHIGSLSQIDKPGQYSLITGINVDDQGHLYILDQFMKKLEIYKKLSVEERQKLLLEYQQNQ